MREIKFAWICRNIHFNQIERVELTDNDLICGSRPSWITSDNCEVIAKILPTGLPDENGVEIWEGDILSFVPAGSMLFNHPYAPFVVSWVEKEARFTDWSPRDRVEIIGNIYEHKHLLK